MEVEYRKDLNHNYMVITQEELIYEPYCVRMLEIQTLMGVLPLQKRNMDNRNLFYYDITGKQSLQNLYTKASLSHDKLRHFILSIIGTLELACEYLLPEDDFVLSPEHIYLDVVTDKPALCFLSGYRQDCKKQMSTLLEYLMNKVDYNDKEAVLLVYRLYAVSKEEGFTFSHMYEVLYNQRSETRTKEKADMDTQADKMQNNTEKEPTNHPLINMPVVMEKFEEEEEVTYYPRNTYILTVIYGISGMLLVILGFTTGLLYNSYGERIEFGKLFGLLLIVLCVEGYLMSKLWSKENRLTKIVTRSEYIDPRQDYIGTALEKKDDLEKRAVHHKIDPTQLTKREHNLWRGFSDSIGISPDTLLTQDKHEEMVIIEEEAVIEEDHNPTCLLSDTLITANKRSGIVLKSLDEQEYASIPIYEFPFFIGKLRKNVDYCLQKSVVSRYHAKITKEEERYYITDLNSTNGTFVNDIMLATYEKKEIMQEDRIGLANLNFKLLWNM